MGFISLILCLVALLLKKSHREWARNLMTSAVILYAGGIVQSIIRISLNPERYIVTWHSVLAPIMVLTLMIIARVKLNRNPRNVPKKAKARVFEPVQSGRDDIDYESVADEIFDVSLELTNLAGGQLAMEGAARYSMSTINTATMYGTGLYEYSVLLLRARMKKIYTNKVEFESEDNKMIEIFANKMQIPVPAFLKIVDRSGGIRKWEQELKKETKLPMTEYMDKVRVIVNKATRDLMSSSQGNTSSSASSTEHLKKNGEDEFNDGL